MNQLKLRKTQLARALGLALIAGSTPVLAQDVNLGNLGGDRVSD